MLKFVVNKITKFVIYIPNFANDYYNSTQTRCYTVFALFGQFNFKLALKGCLPLVLLYVIIGSYV